MAAKKVEKITWSINRLAIELGMDRKTVQKFTFDAKPCGTEGGHNVYMLKDLMPGLAGYYKDKISGKVEDPEELPPKDRREWYAGERERISLAKELGSLIPSDEYRAELSAVLKQLIQFVDTLPDVMEREIGLTGEQVEKMQAACDEQREALYSNVTDSDS